MTDIYDHPFRDCFYNTALAKIESYEFSHKLSKEDYINYMEIGLFNYIIEYSRKNNIIRNWENVVFQSLYKHKAVQMLSNFQQLVQKNINPLDLASLQFYEIDEIRWEEKIKNYYEKMEATKNIEQSGEQITDLYTCGKCKKNHCKFYDLQIRSADEPMTSFITCLNCGKKWRQ